MLRSSARRGFSVSGRRPPPKRRRSGLRASAKATCPWCHGTLHGAAFSSGGFVPPDVAAFLGWEATAPGACQLLLRSRKPASAPDGELRALDRLAELSRGPRLRWSPARAQARAAWS